MHSEREQSRPIERVLARLLHARVVVAVVAVVVVVLADVAMFGLRVQNDLEAFFVKDDPVMIAWQEFRARYGTDEVVVIAIGDDDETLHTDLRRRELATLTKALTALPDVDRVQSLANVETIERTHDAQGKVDGFVTRTVDADSERLLREARARHGLLTRLASDDDNIQIVWLWLKPEATDDAGRSRAVAAIDAAVQPLRAQRTVRVVGGGLVWEALNGITVRDGAVFISLASLVLLVGLLLVTRRVLWAVVAVVAVSCANIVVLGAMALLHVPLNAITVCLPSLVMALGVLDLLHLISAVDDLPADVVDASDPRVPAALAHVAVPGLFNIVTTVVGLLALLTASTTVTRQLGGFAALGVVCAWLFCLAWTIVAVPRALHPKHRRRRHEDHRRSPSAVLAALAIRHRVVVVVVAAVVAVVSVVGITRLRVDTDTLGYLPKQHPLVADTRAVERELGPFIPLEIDLAVPGPGAWRHTAMMTALRDASARLAAHGDVVVDGAAADAPPVRFGRAISVADVFAEVDDALALDDDTPLGDHVDASMALIAATAPGLLDGIVSADDQHLRFTVPVTLTTARGFIAAGDVVDRTLHESLRRAGVGTVTVTLTGYLPLYAQIVHALVDDQLASFAVAFVGVFVLIGLFLRSARLLVLAALPNLLPIVGVLGLMGALDIALDVATITIAATILGVVVDDTVHSLHRLRAQLAMHGPGPWPRAVVDDAILVVARSVGRANLAGNALLAAGFLVLVAASATSLVLVGGLSAAAVGLALVADLVVLPALASTLLAERR